MMGMHKRQQEAQSRAHMVSTQLTWASATLAGAADHLATVVGRPDYLQNGQDSLDEPPVPFVSAQSPSMLFPTTS